MQELIPNTAEASVEKHLPSVHVSGGTVSISVGEPHHPMTEEHGIQWVYLLTTKGGQLFQFTAGERPEAEFSLAGGDFPLAAYAYCNLHGLWKTVL